MEEMDEIVISGIAGKFPESENVHEFRENLFTGVDMVTDDERRWKSGIYGLPPRTGKLKQLDQFDADFFGVHAKQGNSMDPQLRILLELVHEAIMDAGVNPTTMRGSNTGVFIGCSGSESEKEWFKNCHKVPHGYTLTGCHRGMFSNRVSFTFNFHGPSFTVDTACSSSFVALSQAVASIRLGHCDSAIVGGIHLCLEPEISLQYNNLKMLAADGKCKAFDISANGYVRSEAAVAIFLQKKRLSRRYYASLLAARTNSDGFKDQGITFPSRERQMALLGDTYAEAKVNPLDVTYVEAHGTGTQAGDKEELTALATFFCKGRENGHPLLIGSVKSNMGHSEPSSGLCALAKILLSIEQGVLPGNLHFNTPNPNIPALSNGQLKVVVTNTPLEVNNTVIGLNSFGFGGANVHIVLKSPSATPTEIKPVENIPYVIPYSSRTKEAVSFFLNQITSKDAVDLKAVALLHEISKADIPGFEFRGYALFHHGGANKNKNREYNGTTVEINSDPSIGETRSHRPLWFIFNGMGSQWPSMGKDLLNFPVCADSLKRSAKVLRGQDLDLLEILLNTNDQNQNQLDNVLHAFVAITSVQIALVDLLTSLSLEPDGIMGHSIGELACAYADGCLSAEQVSLSAYWRGQAILESGLNGSAIEGAMAAVGLTWDEAKSKCPPGIYPACHNSKDSVTISGPVKEIKNFVIHLQSQNVFAKEVNSSGQAFHSKYIEPSRPIFKKYLDVIIPEGKLRSSRWISTSIPEDQWDSELCKYSSTDYHVNNLISPVLFKEALEKIPESSIVIEIGPHALLQAILKRALPNCSNIGMLNKNQDNSSFLCQALGKMYNCGLNPDFGHLYPKMEFPVFIEKPWEAPLVSWNHSSSWDVPKFSNSAITKNIEANSSPDGLKIGIQFSLEKESDKFLLGSQIDGQILFPTAGYIFIIWKAFAKLHQTSLKKFPVVLENFQISRATVLSKEKGSVQFHINMLPGSGHFEIEQENNLVASGSIRRMGDEEGAVLCLDKLKKTYTFEFPTTFEEVLEKKQDKNPNAINLDLDPQKRSLSGEHVYKELRLRGLEYTGEFRGIHKYPIDGGWSLLQCFWDTQNQVQNRSTPSKFPWISFLDTVFQLGIIDLQPRALYMPTFVDTIILHPEKLFKSLNDTHGQKLCKTLEQKIIPVHFDRNLANITGAGVQISGLKMKMAMRSKSSTVDNPSMESNPRLKLEKCKFTPYFDEQMMDQDENCLDVCVQIVLENVLDNKLNVLEIIKEDFTSSLILNVHSIIQSQPMKFCQGNILQLNGKKLDQKYEKMLKTCGIMVKKGVDSQLIDVDMKKVNLLICTDEKILESVAISMEDGAFVLYKTSIKLVDLHELTDLLKTKAVVLVTYKKFPAHNEYFYLFKKIHSDNITISRTTETVEINTKSDESDDEDVLNFNYKWVDDLKAGMKKAVELKNTEENQGFRIHIISRNCSNFPSGALGLINSLRKEPGGENIRCFLTQNESNVQKLKVADFPAEILQRDLVMNVFNSNSNSNVWGSYRFYPIKMSVDDDERLKLVEHAFLGIINPGNLSSFQWIESPLKYHRPQSDICAVYYAALNFRDSMCTGKFALDQLASPENLMVSKSRLGIEFSGKDQTGHGKMGLVPVCSLATSILPDPDLLWSVPSKWALKESATIPVAYSTAYYALCVRGGLKSGETILIHCGISAGGIALITIALSTGCLVFTTVDSCEKKQFLQQWFPQLAERFIINTADSSFLQHIQSETKGRGVDLLVNSFPKNGQLQASIKCLALQGRFLEMGKVDWYKSSSSFGTLVLLKNVSVHEILLKRLQKGDAVEKRRVQRLVQCGIDSGVVQPLPFTVFSDSLDDVKRAFRFMASQTKEFRGKILIEIRNEESESETESEKGSTNSQVKIVKAIPQCYFDPSKSYIIVGGLGGFGLELCGWLIQRGARKLVLVSRSGVRNGYQDHRLRTWKNLDLDPPARVVSITTKQADVTTVDGALNLLRMSLEAFDHAPIGGIWNLGMVLADGLLENQTPEKFDIVSRPKVNCSIALDKASRQLAPSLDHFVVFSSVVSGRGAAGLSNYAWANSAQERICENRRENGLPGLAIMWGAIGDVGVLQDEKGMGKDGIVAGTCPQRIQSCLQTLDILIHESETKSDSCVLSSLVLPKKLIDGTTKSSNENSSKTSDTRPRLVESVARILGLGPEEEKNVHPQKKLAEMGLDSLISMEVKQLLEVNLEDLILTSKDIPGLTFEKINHLENSLMSLSEPTPSDIIIENSNSNVNTPSSGCVVNVNEIENLNPGQKEPGKFSTTNSKLKSKSKNLMETTVEFPIDHTSFCKTKSKISRGRLRGFSSRIRFGLSYLKSILVLFFVGFLCAISLIFRQVILAYMKLFQSSASIKLMDGPFEQIFSHNPRGSTMIIVVKLGGISDRSKITKILQERVFDLKISQDGASDDKSNEYAPYDFFRWRIQSGVFFNYWIKDLDFDVENHVDFKICSQGMNLDAEALKLSDFYTNHEWDSLKPQWKFHVVAPDLSETLNLNHNPNQNQNLSPVKNPEFLLIFSVNHAYGDAYSFETMMRHCFIDASFSNSNSRTRTRTESQAPSSVISISEIIPDEDSENWSKPSCTKVIFSSVAHTFSRIHLCIMEMTRIRSVYQTSRLPFPKNPGGKKQCAISRLSLSQIKSVRCKDSGKPAGVSAVILHCLSAAYEKIYSQVPPAKLRQVPKNLLTYIPNSIFPYERLSFINNYAVSYTAVPILLKNRGTNRTEDRLQTIQQNLTESTQLDVLEASYFASKVFSLLTNQLKSFAYSFLPTPTFLYTSVPLILSGHGNGQGAATYLGGHEIKEFYGFSILLPGSHGAMGSMIDNIKGTVILCLILDQSVVEMSRDFQKIFFDYFQQELTNLTSEKQVEESEENNIT